MKKVYYTELAMISLNHEFVVNVDGVDNRVSILHGLSLIGDFHGKDLKEQIYQHVRTLLGNDDFLLIPSPHQSELDALREDQLRHPHKYPLGPHEGSILAGMFREDSWMATWGKKEIRINEYEPESTMYYEYSTVTDSYYFKTIWNEDFGLGNERFETEDRFNDEIGEAMMEALINHVLSFKCGGDFSRFVERYVLDNRFRK